MPAVNPGVGQTVVGGGRHDRVAGLEGGELNVTILGLPALIGREEGQEFYIRIQVEKGPFAAFRV